jgi:hypothetical protein
VVVNTIHDDWWRIRKSAQFMFGRCLKIQFVSRLSPHENEFATSICVGPLWRAGIGTYCIDSSGFHLIFTPRA